MFVDKCETTLNKKLKTEIGSKNSFFLCFFEGQSPFCFKVLLR